MRYLFSSARSPVREVFILAAKRTPIGSFNGRLSSFEASDLGGHAVRAALNSISLDPREVDEVILGNVLGAGQGQAPARQAALKGGLRPEVTCTTINKVCSSGLKSLVFASQSIALSHSECVVAGGFESMSRAPHMLLNVELS
jgi:acetyl-CoA C-acetyltransferase